VDTYTPFTEDELKQIMVGWKKEWAPVLSKNSYLHEAYAQNVPDGVHILVPSHVEGGWPHYALSISNSDFTQYQAWLLYAQGYKKPLKVKPGDTVMFISTSIRDKKELIDGVATEVRERDCSVTRPEHAVNTDHRRFQTVMLAHVIKIISRLED
jgi:hypothetical protein